jgi:hypothetical protein
MPGFKINNTGDGPDAKTETYRTHRFKLETFFGKPGDKPPFDMLKEVDLPDRLIEELQVKTPGGTYKFGKQLGYTDLKLTFYVPKDLLFKLEEILTKVGDNINGIGDFDKYVGTITIIMQYQDQDFKLTFVNSWISNISYGQLSYGSSELKSITVTVKFSWYKTELG